MASLNVSFCPEAQSIQFSVIERENNRNYIYI